MHMKRLMLLSLIAWGGAQLYTVHATVPKPVNTNLDISNESTALKEDVVDEVRAVIYHNDGAEIVLTSDIRPSLDGTPRFLRDIILESLQVIKARSYNITISEEDIERFLVDVQKTNQMSRKGLEQLMGQYGWSFDEGKEHLQRRKLIEQLMELMVGPDPRLKISPGDVQVYDEEHPAYAPATYTLSQAVLSDIQDLDSMSKEELEALDWEEPFEVAEDELAEDKQFIVDESEGAIIDQEVVSEGLEITRLLKKVPRHRLTVEERYDAIASHLYMTRFTQVVAEYHKKLLDEAAIRFTYDEDRLEVMKEVESYK